MSSTQNIDFFSKAFWKSRRGQITFCVLGMLASLLFLLIQFGDSLFSSLSANSNPQARERELKKLKAEQVRLKNELANIEIIRQAAAGKLQGAWRSRQLGEPEVELRGMIGKTAKNMDLRLNNISTVRRNNFNKDISLLEVDVTLNTDLETLMRFLLAVDKLEPALYWKRFECRMSNFFGQNSVQFNGTLRCANDERIQENTEQPLKRSVMSKSGVAK